MNNPLASQLPLASSEMRGWPWTAESTSPPSVRPDGTPWPRVSIITPSLNQGPFLEETIRSVLLQSYENLEFIFIDGGSTDNSVDIIEKYQQRIDYCVSEPDDGQASAINKGFSRATGDIFTWLNSDDYLLPGALYTVANAYRSMPDAGAWFGGCQRVDEHGSLIGVHWPKGVSFRELGEWSSNWVQQPACFFSRSAWETCGPLDTNLYSAFDFDFWLKLAKRLPIETVDAELAAARIHQAAKSQRQRETMHAEIWAVMIRHGFERSAVAKMNERLADPSIAEMNAIREERDLARQQAARYAEELDTIHRNTLLSSRISRATRAMAKAYDLYASGDWPELRAALLQVLKNDPTWLGRRGFLSMLAQAYGFRRSRWTQQQS